MKSTQNKFEVPAAKLSVSVSINTNSRYCMSDVALVQEALVIHRDTCTNLFLESLQEGEYRNAYGYYTSFQDINRVLDEMLTKVTQLSESNYLAEQYARNPAAYSPVEESNDNGEVRYQSWLKEILPEGVSDEPENEGSEALEPILDPKYYLDLTDDELSVMDLLQSRGLSKENLQRWAVNFQNKHTTADSASQDSTPLSDQPTPAEQ